MLKLDAADAESAEHLFRNSYNTEDEGSSGIRRKTLNSSNKDSLSGLSPEEAARHYLELIGYEI